MRRLTLSLGKPADARRFPVRTGSHFADTLFARTLNLRVLSMWPVWRAGFQDLLRFLMFFLGISASPLCFGAAADERISLSVEGASRSVEAAIRGYVLREPECTGDITEQLSKFRQLTRRALDSLGYYAAEVTLSAEGCSLRVDVVQKERSLVESFNIAWGPSDLPENLADRIEGLISPATPFVPEQYEQAKRSTLDLLQGQGYLDSQFSKADVVVDPEQGTALINWVVDAGTRYRISALRIEQTNLRDKLFERYLELQVGEPLRAAEVAATYENLVASDYFGRVRVTPQLRERADGEVPVLISATPAPRWSVLGGFGFATDTGPRARVLASSRYLNKRGHRLELSSLVSPVTGEAKAGYRWPYGDPKHQWYEATTRYSYENTDTAESDTVSVGLRRLSRLSKRWTYTLYTDVLSEKFEIADQDQRSNLWLFGSNLAFSSSIDAARPMRGTHFSADLRGAHSTLFSETDVLQLRVQAKQIVPFFARTRWLFRAEAGITWQDEFEELPASIRFFTGGDKSVRGYELDEIGPEDASGEVVGGRRLLNFSAEFDIPIKENWSLALFSDVGSAFDTEPDFVQSVGVGARWYSPIGPIRVDLAHPFQQTSRSFRLHISLGPDI